MSRYFKKFVEKLGKAQNLKLFQCSIFERTVIFEITICALLLRVLVNNMHTHTVPLRKINLLLPRLIYYRNFHTLDLNCYTTEVGDDLYSVEDIYIPEKSIFFFETSCKGGLDSRQACAVESAARSNPNWQINILFAGPVKLEDLQSNLYQYPNIKFTRIFTYTITIGTSLEPVLKNKAFNTSGSFALNHASDILKYFSLYKWGGVVLDLDMIVVKSFDTLAKNWVANEMEGGGGAGAIAFSRDAFGRRLAKIAFEKISENYNPRSWNDNSVGIITRTLNEICSTEDWDFMTPENCNGIEIYNHSYFYPKSYNEWKEYFKPGEPPELGIAYGFHIWNRLSSGTKVTNDSCFAKLARRFCPTTYSLYGEDFGS